MKKNVLTLNHFIPPEPDAGISFGLFIDFVNERIEKDKGNRKYFYKYIADKFRQYPELAGTVPVDKIGQYEDILQLIVYCVIPMIENEDEILWGFGKAFSPEIFYGSDAFYKLIGQINALPANEVWRDEGEAVRFHKELKYSFILDRIYGIGSFFNREWIHRIVNPDTGLYQYYRMSVDRRFAGLTIKGDLPDFHNYSLEACNTGEEAMNLLEEELPMQLFEGTGFTITSLKDVTAQQVREQMARATMDESEIKGSDCIEHVNRLLQTVIGSSAYRFGMLPFLAVNHRAAVLYDKFQFSIIAGACWKKEISKHAFTSFLNALQHEPGIKMYGKNAGAEFFPPEIRDALQEDGILFYMSFPAYYSNQLQGILEVSSSETDVPLNDQQLAALQPAIHIVARLLQQLVNKFNLYIENIVKDRFTNIQPSVQWKFNEVAWHYLRDRIFGSGGETIENVSFPGVYPLYGSVDIRNSTMERNRALSADIGLRILLLKEALEGIEDPLLDERISEVRNRCNEWLNESPGLADGNEDEAFNDFLRTSADPLLQVLLRLSPDAAKQIQQYYDILASRSGTGFDNREKLEMSMQLINNAVNYFYEGAKQNLQEIYPCYFDKFRTDGVEYDIYIGQSMAPGLPFTKEHLHQFRSWQLHSMVDIAGITQSLLPQMPVPLVTTQMIFVHSGPIDISFRNDERRFDVEGAYNIRYQIVKKRIDKANIRGTDQRLSQPGKIAIVYFNKQDAEEWLGYIRVLQEQGLLLQDLEYLELQELQGVAGLHGLRVGIRGLENG
jgi:GAF domain-containing protein